ncbi:MAG: hypothetical protein EHM42_15025, partial [Planctomycetaceae bacterium]
MKSPNSEVTFRIVLVKPTAGVDFGLQQGKGADYETVQKQRSTGADLTFALSARFKPGIDGEPPDFLGPFVQGPKGGRFIYIDIGACAGQANTP